MMNIQCGLEFETYKYIYGTRNKYNIPFDENKSISLMRARNDCAAVQLLLYSSCKMIVCVNNDACFYERGPIDIVRVKVKVPGIDEKDIKVNLVGLVEDDDRQFKSDILLDQTFIHVEGGRIQPVWIEVTLDKDVICGIYRPEITVFGHSMFEDEILIRALSYEIRVADLVLDDFVKSTFYLDLWQHNSNIARKYDVSLWSDEHFNIVENFLQALAGLGQKAISVIVSEIPWSGQWGAYNRIEPSNLFEYNIVKVRLRNNGEWVYDFNALNRYIKLCMKHGINEEIEVFGLINIWLMEDVGFGRVIDDYSDSVRIRYYDEQSGTYKFIRSREQLKGYIAALERNFIDKGWIDRVRVVVDEPGDIEVFKERMRFLKENAPRFKYKAAINNISFIENDNEGIDDYVPILPCVCREFDKIRDIKNGINGKIAYYVCCWPDLPNTFICSNLLESRLIPWLAWYLNLDGFLRWNFTVWPNDPLKKITYQYPEFKAGDTNFVYPGKYGKPMLTLRYKSLQKGIRDYGIIKKYVAKTGEAEFVTILMKKVFLWTDISELMPEARKTREELFSLNYEDYETIIEEIIAKLKECD